MQAHGSCDFAQDDKKGAQDDKKGAQNDKKICLDTLPPYPARVSNGKN